MSVPKPKKILIIAYHFHPDREIGAIRSVKFAEYLPEFGWEPHVLTVEQRYYEKVESTDLPFPCKIERTRKWWVLGDYYLWLKSKILRRSPTESRAAATRNENIPETGYIHGHPNSYWRRFFHSFSWTPDNHVGWLVPAFWRAWKTVRQEKIDIVYSSGPPQTGHLVALLTSWVTRKPFVADFRDPWTQSPKSREMTTGFSLWLEQVMERLVIQSATLVIGVSESVTSSLAEIYSPLLDSKSRTLLNGFDPKDFDYTLKRPGNEETRQLVFLYAGSLYMGRDPRMFLVALGELIAEGKIPKGSVRVDFYGAVDVNPTPILEIIKNYELSDAVGFHASVPRTDYLKMIMQTDVLIVVQSDETLYAIPAKSYEYLATGNEILALSSESALTKLLRDFPQVHALPPTDKDRIKVGIIKIITRIRSGQSSPSQNRGSLQHLHRRELTGQLAKYLDEVFEKSQKK